MKHYLFLVRYLIHYTTVDSVANTEESVESIVVSNVRSAQEAWLHIYEKVRNYTLVSIDSKPIDCIIKG